MTAIKREVCEHGFESIQSHYRTQGHALVDRLADYLCDSTQATRPVTTMPGLEEALRNLDVSTWMASGNIGAEGLLDLIDRYLAHSTRLHHPTYLAHQVAVPAVPAALADMIHGLINNPMAIYEMGPSAAAAEVAVVRWMLEKVGWIPEAASSGAVRADQPAHHSAGVLTHGGSLANLTALLAARARVARDAWDRGTPNDLAVLVPPSSHYSVARAVSIMGLGRSAIYPLPVDKSEVVRPDALEGALERVTLDGRRCMAVVANAGSTSTGIYDPISAIGDFCEEHRLWLHVDGCHGASALLSERERHHLDGLHKADSIVWDAHKMLRVSSLCTAVLFRSAYSFREAFDQQASYLFYGNDVPGIDLMPRTVECTKAGLGLKVLLNLCWYGEQGLGAYIDRCYALARRFAEMVRARPGFECPFETQSNIVCFRWGQDDATQVAIREKLLRSGRFHITSTVVSGHRYLRVTIMSPQTDEATLESLLDAVADVGENGLR